MVGSVHGGWGGGGMTKMYKKAHSLYVLVVNKTHDLYEAKIHWRIKGQDLYC